MKPRAALVPTVLFLAMVFPLSTASAESITIQSGSMTAGPFFFTGAPEDFPTLDIRGTHGFRVTGVPDIASATGPWQCRPCDSSNGVQVTNFQGGTDLPAAIEFEGRHFRQGPSGVDATVQLAFLAATLIFPPPLSSNVVLSEGFELSGSLRLPDVGGEPVPFIPLFGRGTATIELMPDRGGAPIWEFKRASYVFESAPVPEPATLLLVGGAMIGAAGRRTRRLVSFARTCSIARAGKRVVLLGHQSH